MGQMIKAQTLLEETQKAHKALVSINVENMETMQALLEAAAECHDPVFIALSERTLQYAPARVYVAMAEALSKNLDVRYAIHLDHATKLSTVEECLTAGFNSIMFDGSFYDYEDNIKVTQQVVAMCKTYGAAVEAELGHVGGKKDLVGEKESLLTDPKDAHDFVKLTGIDSLAISIGNSHGFYKCVPNIHFDVLSAIREAVSLPLVLHGASGLSDEVVRKCIKLGISRINFCTELRNGFSRAVESYFAKDHEVVDPKKYLSEAREAFKQDAIRIFKAVDGK